MIRQKTFVLVMISLVITSVLLLTSCTKRLNCDSSDNENLGTTDYSEAFKAWSIETDSEILSFYSNDGDTLRLAAQSIVVEEPRWLIESVVCEEALDVKPFKAYAYYEYEDKTRSFGGENDKAFLSIEPEIALHDEVRTESIFITLSTGAATSIKGQVPVTNSQSIPQSEPFGLHFTHLDRVELGDQAYTDIWVLSEDTLSIFYHSEIGIAALAIDEQIYHRLR
jgi:hypothetical protein